MATEFLADATEPKPRAVDAEKISRLFRGIGVARDLVFDLCEELAEHRATHLPQRQRIGPSRRIEANGTAPQAFIAWLPAMGAGTATPRQSRTAPAHRRDGRAA